MKAQGGIDVQGLLYRCRTEGMEAIADVYKLYRDEFLHFARRSVSHAPRELVLDAWHDAVIDFYEIALAGKYDPGKSGMKTFLFAIGKYKLFNLLKKNDRVQLAPFEENEFKNRPEFVWLQQEHLTEQEELIKKALSQLGEKCRELLVLVYYHQYSSDAVKTAMNYGKRQPDGRRRCQSPAGLRARGLSGGGSLIRGVARNGPGRAAILWLELVDGGPGFPGYCPIAKRCRQ